MGLLDEVAAEVRGNGSMCAVAAVRAALNPADATDLDAVIGNPLVHGAAVARALTNRGHKISGGSIQRHRRGDCTCG